MKTKTVKNYVIFIIYILQALQYCILFYGYFKSGTRRMVFLEGTLSWQLSLWCNSKTMFFSFQMCITGGLGIPGTQRDPSSSRNVFVSWFFHASTTQIVVALGRVQKGLQWSVDTLFLLIVIKFKFIGKSFRDIFRHNPRHLQFIFLLFSLTLFINVTYIMRYQFKSNHNIWN